MMTDTLFRKAPHHMQASVNLQFDRFTICICILGGWLKNELKSSKVTAHYKGTHYYSVK